MKIAMVCSKAFSVWQFRRELVTRLLELGHEVTIYAPDDDEEPRCDCIRQFREMGAGYVVVPFYRFVNPWRDLQVTWQLYRLFRRNRPDVVFTMSVKPNTYGALAARAARIPRIVSLVCGAGYGFIPGESMKQRLVRRAVRFLYRLGGRCMTRMWFLNEDDRELFIGLRIVRRDRTIVITSEGVNLEQYSPERVAPERIAALRREFIGEGKDDDATQDIEKTVIVGCFPGRNTWSKGIREFVETAKLAKHWKTKTRFVLVGSPDPDAGDCVPEAYYREEPALKTFAFRPDIVDVLAATDILTLPSFYREGVPRILLEGLAMKKPIVTTDNVGCRNTVDEGVNGFLVPPRDTVAFAEAVKRLADDPELRGCFARAGYEKAKREFDVHKVNERVIREVLGLEVPGENVAATFSPDAVSPKSPPCQNAGAC